MYSEWERKLFFYEKKELLVEDGNIDLQQWLRHIFNISENFNVNSKQYDDKHKNIKYMKREQLTVKTNDMKSNSYIFNDNVSMTFFVHHNRLCNSAP